MYVCIKLVLSAAGLLTAHFAGGHTDRPGQGQQQPGVQGMKHVPGQQPPHYYWRIQWASPVYNILVKHGEQAERVWCAGVLVCVPAAACQLSCRPCSPV